MEKADTVFSWTPVSMPSALAAAPMTCGSGAGNSWDRDVAAA